MAITEAPEGGIQSKKTISRRSFLRGAAVAAGGVALAGTGLAVFARGGEQESPQQPSEARIGILDTPLTLENLPESKEQIYLGNAEPANLVIRRGGSMSVKGLYVSDTGEESIVFSVTDPKRKAQDGKPQSFSGIMPLTLQGGGEGTGNFISFTDILSANGGSIDKQNGVVTFKDGKKGTLKSISKAEVDAEKAQIGAFFVDVDPLKKNPDGSRPLHENPVVPAPDASFQVISNIMQTPDGRVVGVGADGQTQVTRARFIPWRNRWEWQKDQEAINDYTINEMADALGLELGLFGNTNWNISYITNPEVINIMEKISNKYIIGGSLWTRVVFQEFNQGTWRNILGDWDNISQKLNNGVIPEGFNYNWYPADRVIEFAEKQGVKKIRAESLLYGKDVLDSVRNGNFSPDEMKKIYEFMVKTRVLKYKGRVQEWDVVDEFATDMTVGRGQPNGFLYEKMGEGIIEDVARWAREVDTDAKLLLNDDNIHTEDTQNFRNIRAKFFNLIQQYRDKNVPIDKVTVQNNHWIYALPTKEKYISDIKRIQSLGYEYASSEATMNVHNADPFWTNRKTNNAYPNPFEVQAQAYKELLEACLETGSEFSLGGHSDKYSWLADVKHPETKAMIFDENGKPKPAYFAILGVLKSKLESAGVLQKAA